MMPNASQITSALESSQLALESSQLIQELESELRRARAGACRPGEPTTAITGWTAPNASSDVVI